MIAIRLLPDRIAGRHVFMALAVFFGVMIVANGLFLYFALSTFNGFEEREAYRKGLDYNQRIEAARLQARQGWIPEVRYSPSDGRLHISVRDGLRRPVAGLRISGELRRPATDAADRALTMREVAPAHYVAELPLAPGQWTLVANLYKPGRPDVPAHRIKRRLWVSSPQ